MAQFAALRTILVGSSFNAVRLHSRSFLVKKTPFPVVNSRRLLSSTKSCFKKEVDQDEEEMDELQKNPYFDKYADKIAKLQKTSPEEFLNRLATAEEKKKKLNKTPLDGVAPGPSQEKEFSLPSKPKKDLKEVPGMSKEKKLSDRMKTELLEDKSAEEIATVWREYHAKKDAVAAVIPADMFKQMQERFNQFKTFLFPLPRKQGYEFIVVQFEGKEAHFTSLINYQAFQENAPECFTMVHYTEFAESKGIVLMVGEFDTNAMTVQEAQCLANEVEMYYCNPSEEKLALLKTFTEKPDQFKHADLIAQLDTVNLLANKTQ